MLVNMADGSSSPDIGEQPTQNRASETQPSHLLLGDLFKEDKQAGADAVMSATGAMWNPELSLLIGAGYKHR